jgi:hypothetical protein
MDYRQLRIQRRLCAPPRRTEETPLLSSARIRHFLPLTPASIHTRPGAVFFSLRGQRNHRKEGGPARGRRPFLWFVTEAAGMTLAESFHGEREAPVGSCLSEAHSPQDRSGAGEAFTVHKPFELISCQRTTKSRDAGSAQIAHRLRTLLVIPDCKGLTLPAGELLIWVTEKLSAGLFVTQGIPFLKRR